MAVRRSNRLPDPENCVFYAEAEGTALKDTFKLLQKDIRTANIVINPRGIFSRNNSPNRTYLIDIEMPQDKFNAFHFDYHSELHISVIAKTFAQQLSKVKKKDIVAYYILKSKKDGSYTGEPQKRLYKSILPTSYSVNALFDKTHVHITIPDEPHDFFDPPEVYPPYKGDSDDEDDEVERIEVYGNGISISTSDFTAAKGRLIANKDVRIVIYEGKFIEFAVDSGETHSVAQSFGIIPEGAEEYEEDDEEADAISNGYQRFYWDGDLDVYRDDEDNIYNPDNDMIIGRVTRCGKKQSLSRILNKHVDALDEEYGKDSYIMLKKAAFENMLDDIRHHRNNPSDSTESEDGQEEDVTAFIDSDIQYSKRKYQADFSKNAIALISKMKDIGKFLQFYSPRVDNCPLKVRIDSGTSLANVTVYLKNELQISYESTQRRKNDV